MGNVLNHFTFMMLVQYTSILYGAQSKKPNIMIILIDDMGWNDVSWHNGSDYGMPYIDALAKDSLILNNIQHTHSI